MNRFGPPPEKCAVRFGPLSYAKFLELLPDSTPVLERKTFFTLAHLIRLYAGPELDFEVQLRLRAEEIPQTILLDEGTAGPGARLGWNTWLCSLSSEEDADDAVFALEAVSRLAGNQA